MNNYGKNRDSIHDISKIAQGTKRLLNKNKADQTFDAEAMQLVEQIAQGQNEEQQIQIQKREQKPIGPYTQKRSPLHSEKPFQKKNLTIQAKIDEANEQQQIQQNRRNKIKQVEHQIKESIKKKVTDAVGEYKYGDFSRYAYQKQVQLSEYQVIINNVIEQALQSHLKQLKNVIQVQQQLTRQSKKNFAEVKQILSLEKQSQFRQFLANPVQFFIQKTVNNLDINYNLENFIGAVLKANQYIFVQNKLINKKQLNINEYLHAQSHIYVPFKRHQNLYIKDSTQSFNINIEGKLQQKQQLKKLSNQERMKIIQSVTMFLKDKKIIVKEESIDDRINQILLSKQKA